MINIDLLNYKYFDIFHLFYKLFMCDGLRCMALGIFCAKYFANVFIIVRITKLCLGAKVFVMPFWFRTFSKYGK